MSSYAGITPQSGLTDVLARFPRNSERLFHLLHDIMCGDGELTRGEREAIAAFVSQQNDVGFCNAHHTAFSEAFSGPIETTYRRIQPLLDYARQLNLPASERLDSAFEAATRAGWSERALYEVVEITGIFNMVNTIVRAAGLSPPMNELLPGPTREDLSEVYLEMAEAINGPEE